MESHDVMLRRLTDLHCLYQTHMAQKSPGGRTTGLQSYVVNILNLR